MDTIGIDIGLDCENIIKDYLNQLVITERFNNVLKQMERENKFTLYSTRFSGHRYGTRTIHYYLSSSKDLLVIRNKIHQTFNEILVEDIEIVSVLP